MLVIAITSLNVTAQQKNHLSTGQWRGELERADGNHIVFNFEVSKIADKPIIYIRNATERLTVDDITVQDDSVFIRLPFFDSQFRAAFVGDRQIKGIWIKRLADRDQVMPFIAVSNGKKTYRFKTGNTKPVANITGRWATTFLNTGNGRIVKAVGVFKQEGTVLTGSFLTPSGDYRYLEGVVDGDSLKLSGFDGGYAYTFVYNTHWFTTLALMVGGGFNNTRFEDRSLDRQSSAFGPHFNSTVRFAVGYNSRDWFAGFFYVNFLSRNYADYSGHLLWQQTENGLYRLVVAKRISLRRKK